MLAINAKKEKQGWRWEGAGQFGAFAVVDRVSREGFTEQRTFELKGGGEWGACVM